MEILQPGLFLHPEHVDTIELAEKVVKASSNCMQLGPSLYITLPTIEGKRLAVVGKSGSGKTNTLLIIAKRLLDAGWTVFIVDPMNNFRKLRAAGLPFVVAGARDSADVKLTPDNAAALAEFGFHEGVSMILDVSMHESDMEVLQPFLQTLWWKILSQHEDGPFNRVALLIDEGQLYIPQNGKTDISSLILDMTKRGRQLHLSMAIATQRPASLQKNYLTQANVTFFHSLRSADIKPVLDDLPLPEKEVRALMRRVGKGQVVVIGDPDMVTTGEEDYILESVEEWVSETSPKITSNSQATTRQLDGDLLSKLRSLAGKPPIPTADASPAAAEAYKQTLRVLEEKYETQRKRDNANMSMLLATYIGTVKHLLQAYEALKANPPAAESPEPKFIVASDPGISPTAITVMEVGTNGQLEPYQSPKALARAISKQKKQFTALLSDLKQLPPYQQLMLCYLTRYEGQEMELRSICRFIGISENTVLRNPPTNLIKRKFLERRYNRGAAHYYRSKVRRYVETAFPDLDGDELVNKIIGLQRLT